MRRRHKYGLLVSLTLGLSLAAPVALPVLGGTAAAQAENNRLIAQCSAGAGGNGDGAGGDGTGGRTNIIFVLLGLGGIGGAG